MYICFLLEVVLELVRRQEINSSELVANVNTIKSAKLENEY